MANTITYDPSNDPVELASDAARDQENLAQGEKMAQDQSDLLAGKYKNAEDLEKAYLELQSKQGDSPEENTETDSEYEDIPEGYEDKYTEGGEVDYEKVNETYGEQVGTLFKNAGVDPWEISSHFHTNNGTITTEMNQQLLDAGISQGAITSYLSGRARESGYDGGYQGAEMTDQEVAEIQSIAGGKEQYDNLTTWASDNLDKAQIDAFDEVVNTGSKAAVAFAVKAMQSQYEDAVGVQPDLVTGKTARQGAKYRSMAEVVRDMGDPRYEEDSAYRAQIAQKLERSNLKV